MRLADFLNSDGMSATQLAEELGVAISTITRAARGEIVPSRQLMEAIYRHSGGLVTPNDFFDLAGGAVHGADNAPAAAAASTGQSEQMSGQSDQECAA